MLAAGVMSAYGQTAKTDAFIDKALKGPKSGRIQVIVQSEKPLTVADEVKLGKLGGFVYRRLPIVRSTAIDLPAKNLEKVLSLNFVQRASEDVSVKKNDAFTVSSSGANVAWNSYNATGKGVGVAILDSGIRPDNDFSGSWLIDSRVIANVNFSKDTLFANDLCGHGTHVAGIVAGNGKSSSGSLYFNTYYGIAPEANLVNVRVLDGTGGGTVSNVIAGIQWVVNNRKLLNIRVLNMSLSHPIGESYKTDPLCQAVEYAWKSGIVVVCAAGNEGRQNATPTDGVDNGGWGTNYGSIQSPANSPYVITVGAMRAGEGNRSTDQIATYSSRGPSRLDFVAKPDIVAAGNRIVSVLADGGYLDRTYGDINGVPWSEYMRGNRAGMSHEYFRMSGTSMAAPVVSGAAALMLQLQPNLSPDTVKARLMASADKWRSANGSYDLFSYGAGYLNIPNALKSKLIVKTYATSPTTYRDSYGHVVMNIEAGGTGDQGSTGDNGRAMWGTAVAESDVYGSGATSPTGAVSAPDERAMWGTAVWTDVNSNSVNQAGVDLTSIAFKGDK